MKKLKISKEEFVTSLLEIQKGLQRQKEFDDAVSKVTDSFFVCNIGNEFLETAIRLLEIAVDDKVEPLIGSTISWWLFEDVKKEITICANSKFNKTNEDIVVNCTTAAQLYDYFQKWN